MKSALPGRNISGVEIGNISIHGIWLLVRGREYYLPSKDYPWFKDASVAEICNVKLHHGKHLHWPDLDVDLELESLQNPERYPLKYRP